MNYSESTCEVRRWKTREVKVGKIGIGGDNPIRVQSMTTSNTRDVEATVEQVLKLADYGCEMVRVTVQGKKEAEACEKIKSRLIQLGCDMPLVADIHFYPPAAMLVSDFVDKVRINPGNYLDKRATFKQQAYTAEEYQREIERIEEGFAPLVLKCKKQNIAMRIGTNHGSLSDRIMNYYGDTPEGMVEAAFEFARVCRKYDYHNFLFSMKASNPLVMVKAYRLLVAEMMKEGWNYPLHLGVTEAGSGEDGRVKSAVGIGLLLADGLGDTIRCSITEDPWYEMDPCKRLLKSLADYQREPATPSFIEVTRDFTHIERDKEISESSKILHSSGSVILPVTDNQLLSESFLSSIGAGEQFGRIVKSESAVEAVFLEEGQKEEIQPICRKLEKAGIAVLSKAEMQGGLYVVAAEESSWYQIREKEPEFVILELSRQKIHQGRRFFDWLKKSRLRIPVMLKASYEDDLEQLIIRTSFELGSLLADALGEGLVIFAPKVELEDVRRLSFSVLQATRMRSSKTEFIGCPGCGRTLFDLQAVTEIIKEKTAHLPGVKIAIMGCIVNGPGEMADADFGYVGSRPGKVDLYVGKKCIEKNIDFSEAPDRLVDLIKKSGYWKEPAACKERSFV